jgi:hypothetical protein
MSRMRPDHMPPLEGADAERFIRQNTRPLSEKQKAHLRECLHVYLKNPIN